MPLSHTRSAPISTKTPPSDDKVGFVDNILQSTPSADSGLASTPKRHPTSSRSSLTESASLPSLEPKTQTTAIVIDDDENDVMEISDPTPTIARKHATPAPPGNRSVSLTARAAMCAADKTDVNIAASPARPGRALSAPDDPDIVEISRPSFWGKRTQGTKSPRIKTKRPRSPSWHTKQGISKISHPARALTSASADALDVVELTPPIRKKHKSGSPLTIPNARDSDAMDANQVSIAQTTFRDDGAGSMPTTFNTRSSDPMSYGSPEFIQGSSRTPLSGGVLETSRAYEAFLFTQDPKSSSSLSPKERGMESNGQEVIDLTDE